MENFKRPVSGNNSENACDYQNMGQMKGARMPLDMFNDYKEEKETYQCGMVLAMAYVPWQKWSTVYTAEEALCHGTIFPDLFKPWYNCGVRGDKA